MIETRGLRRGEALRSTVEHIGRGCSLCGFKGHLNTQLSSAQLKLAARINLRILRGKVYVGSNSCHGHIN